MFGTGLSIVVCGLVCTALALSAVLVYQTQRDANAHFTRRGVRHRRRPLPFVGHLFWLLCGRESAPDLVLSIYREAKEHGYVTQKCTINNRCSKYSIRFD